jgi:HEAT repeat protein
MNGKGRAGAVLAIASAMVAAAAICRSETFRADYRPPADRALAAACLGDMGSRKAVPLLIKLCADPDGAVRHAAVGALGRIGDPRAVEVLEKIAADPAQESVAGTWLFNGEFRTYGLVPATASYDVRREAWFALARIHRAADPREAIQAIAVLKATDREAVRRAGGLSPDYLKSEQYRKDDREYTRVWYAIDAIANVPGPEGSAALAGLLGCGNENLELKAAYALCGRPAAEVMPLVRPALERDPSNLTLTAGLVVTLKLEPEAAPHLARRLVKALASAEDFHRFPHRARPYLEKALGKDDAPLLESLLKARTDAGEKAAVQELLDKLEGRKPPVDYVEAEEIPEARRAEAVRELLAEVNKWERDWRTFKSIYQLGRLKAKEAVPALWPHLRYHTQGGYCVYKETAVWYQDMAGWALVQIADPDSIPTLREIALDKDADPWVRGAALLAYARLARRNSVADLKLVLQEKDQRFEMFGRAFWHGEARAPRPAFPTFASVREAAAWALADVGGDEARKALTEYLASGESLGYSLAEAVFRVDPEALRAWAVKHTGSAEPATRAAAICVRCALFPESAAPVALEVLRAGNDPLNEAMLDFLGGRQLADEKVVAALVGLLAADHDAKNCNRRLRIIRALGKQGGEAAQDALIRFAEDGKL